MTALRALAALALAVVLAASVQAGNRAFEAGRYEDAVAEYRRALERGDDGPLVHYNLGTALLRLGRHAEAREQLARAASGDAEPGLLQHAHYNAGNADLEPAFRMEPSPERADALRRAILRYRQALLLDPADADAKWNLELAQRLLARQGGGGGGGEDDPRQGGGGGGGDRDDPASPEPAPGADGGGAGMSPAEAERVLRAAAQRDRQLQQEKLRRTDGPPPMVRDW
jgi:tetratricopeptide (TPR) repeat protein